MISPSHLTPACSNNPTPRFVDAHIHLRNNAGLLDLAAAGMLAVRDAGFHPDRKEWNPVRADSKVSPMVISSGWGIYKKGGYGSLFGRPVETRAEIRTEIRKLKRACVGFIKVFASGLVSLTDPGTVTSGGFCGDDLKFLVDEAGSLGLSVMAHANGEPAILASAEAGVQSIEHGYFMTESGLERMGEKGIYWVPTVGALARAAKSQSLSNDLQEHIKSVIREQVSMIRRAYDSGVLLAIGTDCVLPDPEYTSEYRAEMAYYIDSGIPHDDVIAIASDSGAALLGIEVPPAGS